MGRNRYLVSCVSLSNKGEWWEVEGYDREVLWSEEVEPASGEMRKGDGKTHTSEDERAIINFTAIRNKPPVSNSSASFQSTLPRWGKSGSGLI